MREDLPDSAGPWATLPVADLIDHAEAKHHATAKAELPAMADALEAIAALHGHEHPEIVEVAKRFRTFAVEMMVHMRREEVALFPAIVDPERREDLDLRTSIRIMQCDHDEAKQILRRIRALTEDYRPPPNASVAFRGALEHLGRLDAALHEHIGFENDVLFPRALALAT